MNREIEPSPKKVKALDNYLLYIEFEFYKRLIDKKNFKNVKISGINIEWKTGEDIAPETLYYESIPLEKFEGNLQELNI